MVNLTAWVDRLATVRKWYETNEPIYYMRGDQMMIGTIDEMPKAHFGSAIFVRINGNDYPSHILLKLNKVLGLETHAVRI